MRSLLRGMAFAGILACGRQRGARRHESAPIAVPLIGTQGQASLYPSTINVVARGGQGQTGQVKVVLHAVTHPCPEELAVQLVHNGIALPVDEQRRRLPAAAGDDAGVRRGGRTNPDQSASQSGVFRRRDRRCVGLWRSSPVPGPGDNNVFVNALPPSTTNINGAWSLYVIDTDPGNRGVIAGGWSLNYDTSPSYDATQTTVRVPPLSAPDRAAPKTIRSRSTSRPCRPPCSPERVTIDVTLHHTLPRQPPHGAAVSAGHDGRPDGQRRRRQRHRGGNGDALPRHRGVGGARRRPDRDGTIPARQPL